MYWEKVIEWLREKPFYEYFLELSLKSLITYIIFLGIIILGLVIALVRALLKNDLVFASIYAASTAFFGVMLTVIIQTWATIYKSRVEQQIDGTNKMVNYYEKIQKILKNPGAYSLEKISNFIEEFDNKVEMYGSENIAFQWKRLKGRILITQTNPLNAGSRDWHAFRNFIAAIRKEMGHTSSSTLRHYIVEDLKFKYQTRKASLTIQSLQSATSNSRSASENYQQDFQSAWAHWFDEVEQLEPEPPRSEPDEYGKLLIDKYKRQGLDL